MKRVIYITSILLIVSSCGTNNKQEKQNNYEIAENYIEEFQPEKAIPYLKKIEPNDPYYERAQKLLNTIDNMYKIEQKDTDSSDETEFSISKDAAKALTDFQEKWCKEQIIYYESYLVDYKIEDYTVINFILSKEASETGSLSAHEDTHVPILTNRYNDALKENNLPNYPMTIHLKRKDGVSNSQLTTSEKGWLPAEYLWYNVTLYFGEGAEKKYIGKVIDGQEIDGVKYVVVKTKSGSSELKKLDHIKNASYYIKADDPYIKTKVLKFKL